MDKITIFTPDKRKIDKKDFSQILKIVYEKANKIALRLSKDYIKQNQRIEIYFDVNTGNYHLSFFNCTDKYSRSFASLFQDESRFK